MEPRRLHEQTETLFTVVDTPRLRTRARRPRVWALVQGDAHALRDVDCGLRVLDLVFVAPVRELVQERDGLDHCQHMLE